MGYVVKIMLCKNHILRYTNKVISPVLIIIIIETTLFGLLNNQFICVNNESICISFIP